MICSNCGQEILEGSKFCNNCGTKIEEVDNTVEEYTEPVAEPVEEAAAEAGDAASTDTASADTESAIDEQLDSAKEAYEQAASDLSDTADQAMGSDSSSSSFYESTETYTDYSNDIDEEEGGNIGFSIASLVCGCLSILCCFGGCVSWIFSIVAIIMGIITLTKKYDGKGFGIAGIITGGVGILLSIIMVAAMVSTGVLNEFM